MKATTTKRKFLRNVDTDFLRCRAVTRHQWHEVGLYRSATGLCVHIISDCSQCGGSKVQTFSAKTGERQGGAIYFHADGYLAHTGGDRVSLADGRKEYARRTPVASHAEFVETLAERR